MAYPNLEAYYQHHPAARYSAESDYGVWWRDDDGGIWRVSYVHDTGHVYAIMLSPHGATRRAASIGGQAVVMISAADEDHEEGPVLILARLPSYTQDEEREAHQRAVEAWRSSGGPMPRSAPDPLGRVLDGWAEVCGAQGSLGWVRDRVTTKSGEKP